MAKHLHKSGVAPKTGGFRGGWGVNPALLPFNISLALLSSMVHRLP
jgi:hypothetical protein